MYSYDQVLTDVRTVYEQLTGLPVPKADPKNPRFPLPAGVDPISLVQSEINYLNLFLVNSGISLRLSKVPTWAPPAEICESPQQYVISLDLAGLKESDISIQGLDGAVVVKGARNFRKKSEDVQCLSSERTYGAFERAFHLPPYLRTQELHTRLSDGILEIIIPKEGPAAGLKKKQTAQESESKPGSVKQ